VIHCRPTLPYEFRDLPPATECESRLSEILSASIVQAVMRADGVDPGELETMLADVMARRRAAMGSPAGAERLSADR